MDNLPRYPMIESKIQHPNISDTVGALSSIFNEGLVDFDAPNVTMLLVLYVNLNNNYKNQPEIMFVGDDGIYDPRVTCATSLESIVDVLVDNTDIFFKENSRMWDDYLSHALDDLSDDMVFVVPFNNRLKKALVKTIEDCVVGQPMTNLTFINLNQTIIAFTRYHQEKYMLNTSDLYKGPYIVDKKLRSKLNKYRS